MGAPQRGAALRNGTFYALFVALALAVALVSPHLGCNSGAHETRDRGDRAPGQACGFVDHVYYSQYYCGRMGIWYAWRDPEHCRRQCGVAAGRGCDTGRCDCGVDHGTGRWLPCAAASGGEPEADGCFLRASGVDGEAVPCDCR